MAVKNKTQYKLYLNTENAEYVRSVLEKNKRDTGGLSGLFDKHLARTAVLLKEHADLRKGRLTLKTIFKIIKANYVESEENKRIPAK